MHAKSQLTIVIGAAFIFVGPLKAQEQANLKSLDYKKQPNSFWKKSLTPEAYRITREQGTEAPFSGKYWNNHEQGAYLCNDCGAKLFSSQNKFDSGTGWPSFTRVDNKASVEEKTDSSMGMARTEVTCSRCGAHLGHVFDDGPAPTGLPSVSTISETDLFQGLV